MVLVHMTDGSASTVLIPKEELKAIRKEEALRAGEILGVTSTQFLDFEDQKLTDSSAPATERVLEILRRERPTQVFVPYYREPMRQAADHIAATKIVKDALARYGKRIIIWEYPVWFWLHWPWIGLHQRGPHLTSKHVGWNSITLICGAHAFLELRYAVDIREVLAQKLAALAQHKSQMNRLIPDPRWLTLGDLCGGDFLDCFHQECEFFHCYDFLA